MKSTELKFLLLTLIIISSTSHAKRFANQYTEFELPPMWKCALEGAEYVCQSETADRQKEAIIILAAKTRGDQDSLDQYMGYLKKTKTYSLPGGKSQASEAKYTKVKEINGHKWVDSLHLASEIPGFYTRYLATVKEDLGVAVTFSVLREQYENYKPLMDKLVESLRVFRQAKTSLAKIRNNQVKGPNFADQGAYVPQRLGDVSLNKGQKKVTKGANEDAVTLILFLALAGIGFVILKKRKKKKK